MIFIADPYRELFARIGFVPEMIFSHPEIKIWRRLADRENCTWDISDKNRRLRLHVKRFPKLRQSPAKIEAQGYGLLRQRGIPAAELASWGILDDGRSFIAMEDLSDFTPADKLIEAGLPFERLFIPTAELSARLHNAELHHRDLYLCHFMAREDRSGVELRLIDAARVRELPGGLIRRRWIVKDLAQFWYSTTQLNVTDAQRDNWLAEYARRTEIPNPDRLRLAVMRKSDSIAAHDLRIRAREPGRNISIPK